MSKEQSIGIFDSGFGGLTAMRVLRQLLPQENIVYFGDTARLPYGNKSADTIIRYCLENASFLIDQQVKVLLIACHSACTAALDPLRSSFEIPILSISEPGISEVVKATRSNKIGILGTRATISSGVYQQQIQTALPHASIYSVACPMFVPLVEEGFVDHGVSEIIAREYLQPLIHHHVDTVLLGCTHYPLLQPLLQRLLGDDVTLIDPAHSCALETLQLLHDRDWLNPQTTPSQYTFYASDDPDKFRHLGQTFLDLPIEKVFQKH